MKRRAEVVGSLPADLTGFVGRADELALLRQLLSESRLVTLTGGPGVGKTRLALRTARQLARTFPDGAWAVELCSLRDPALLPQTVGRVLGIVDQVAADPIDALSQFLAPRTLLMVIDNCEHLVPACQSLLTAVLQASPGLRVLATSREVLRIPGEQVYAIPPLAVPSQDRIMDVLDAVGHPGVVLFERRAAEVRPGFTVTADNAEAVAAVCSLSEGVPLFLELAAAQLRTLSVEQLASRLEDRFRLLVRRNSAVVPRHQSLRAAVEWSFTLCTEAERLIWARASVFAGRFDLDAAEAVCAGDGLPGDVALQALAGLIDKSVLISAELDGVRRYWMLGTVRAYGLARLHEPQGAGVDEVELRRRHRDHYAAVAEQFSSNWFGVGQIAWSRRIRAELPELRAALSFCLSNAGEAPIAVRLATALDHFWYSCGEAREGSLWLGRALAANPGPSRDRARALAAYTRILTSRSLHAAAVEPARECLDLARQLDDPALLAEAVVGQAVSLLHSGDRRAGLRLLDQGIEQAEALPQSPILLAMATLFRAGAAIADNDPVAADATAARSREVCRAHGDQCWLNYALSMSMLASFMLGNTAQAAVYCRETLAGSTAMGDSTGLALTLEFLAWTGAADSDHSRAARLLGAADRQSALSGGNPTAAGIFSIKHAQCAAAVRAALGDVRYDAEFSAGAAFTLDETLAFAGTEKRPPTPPRAAPATGQDSAGELTRRELEISGLLAEGLTNRQIADRLVISPRTVEGHVEHLLTKLGFRTRTQVASWVLDRRAHAGTQPQPRSRQATRRPSHSRTP